MTLKVYELDIESRPYKIYWHGKMLRSYDNVTDFENGKRFFSGFLIALEFTEVPVVDKP